MGAIGNEREGLRLGFWTGGIGVGRGSVHAEIQSYAFKLHQTILCCCRVRQRLTLLCTM